MLIRDIFRIYLLFLTFVLLRGHTNHRKKSGSGLKEKKKGINKSSRQEQQNFHEVDAFGDDFVDFGAQTGAFGQFSWHADFPLE